MRRKELNDYRATKKEMEQIKERIEEAKELYTQIRGAKLNDMPKSKNYKDNIAESVARLEELKILYSVKFKQMLESQVRVEEQIAVLEPEERMLMRKRYFEGLKWEQICEQMCYSWKTVHRIHNKILIKIFGNTKDDIE